MLIDGAQAVPHVPVDVQAIGADFYAFSGHKMLGPTGSGALWARRELLEAMPPFMAGGDMIREVHLRRSEWNDIPWKFEAGTPDIAAGDRAGRGGGLPGRLGMDRVREHERELLTYALVALQREHPDIALYGPIDADIRGGVIPFNVPGRPPARRRAGAGSLRRRGPRRPPLHDAAPRAPRPRRDRARELQRLHHRGRHRRPDRPASTRSSASSAR